MFRSEVSEQITKSASIWGLDLYLLLKSVKWKGHAYAFLMTQNSRVKYIYKTNRQTLASSYYECYFYKALLAMWLKTFLCYYTIYTIFFYYSPFHYKFISYYKRKTNMNTIFPTFLLCSRHLSTASHLLLLLLDFLLQLHYGNPRG